MKKTRGRKSRVRVPLSISPAGPQSGRLSTRVGAGAAALCTRFRRQFANLLSYCQLSHLANIVVEKLQHWVVGV
jgi:hypothetical protein